MKKQNLIKKMMIALAVFIISIQPVNANENNFNKFTQKFNEFLKCFKKDVSLSSISILFSESKFSNESFVMIPLKLIVTISPGFT